MTPSYSTVPYTVPVPREPGWYTVNCRVTWTPLGGVAVSVTGDYLDVRELGGAVELACGFGEALVDLGLADWRWRDGHVVALCDEVDRQLLLEPTATLKCPIGTAVIELTVPTSKV
jgi:hypothetical protein